MDICDFVLNPCSLDCMAKIPLRICKSMAFISYFQGLPQFSIIFSSSSDPDE